MLLKAGNEDNVNKLNGYLDEIGKYCSYKQWYFGSLHEDRRITPHHTCVFNKIIPIDTYTYESKSGPKQLSLFEEEEEIPKTDAKRVKRRKINDKKR